MSSAGAAKVHAAEGDALMAQRRFEAALACYDQALAAAPAYGYAHFRRAWTLLELQRGAEALAAAEAALARSPGNPTATVVRGLALMALRRVEDAIDAFEAAIALQPGHADAWANLGVAWQMAGRPDEAVAAFDRAIALNPTKSARVNKAVSQLAAGRFAEGWTGYEQRQNYPEACARSGITEPLWLGEPDIRGRTILVNAELGLGDTLQFCRYLPRLVGRGARVLFAPQPPLRTLMRTLGGGIAIVDGPQGQAFDFHCRLLSLPLAFQTTLETVPAAAPYLAAAPERIARWAARIGGEGYRIGVCWRGSADGAAAGRSFPLAALSGIARVPGVRLISLQRGEGAEQLRDLPHGMMVEDLGEDFDAGDQAFLDCAAAIQSCDLVISADTAVAHLAGALDRPVWIALARAADWRWMLNRDDTPWYPKALLFRQARFDDWSGVFADMERALALR